MQGAYFSFRGFLGGPIQRPVEFHHRDLTAGHGWAMDNVVWAEPFVCNRHVGSNVVVEGYDRYGVRRQSVLAKVCQKFSKSIIGFWRFNAVFDEGNSIVASIVVTMRSFTQRWPVVFVRL